MYEHYKKARNRAWEVLLECKINSLPLNLKTIIKHYNITVIPFSKTPNLILNELNIDIVVDDGFSIKIKDKKIIYFNDKKEPIARRRFTIAHELGHCLLNHDLTKIKKRTSETDNVNDFQELEANIFARDILMPAIILKETNYLTPFEIMSLCQISEQSAKYRAERLQKLLKRNKFDTSPLEQEVHNQFKEFIKNNKK